MGRQIPMAQFLWRVPLKVYPQRVARNPLGPDDEAPGARHFVVRAVFNGRQVRFPVSMTHPEHEVAEPTPFLAATALHRVCGMLHQSPTYNEWCRTMQVDPRGAGRPTSGAPTGRSPATCGASWGRATRRSSRTSWRRRRGCSARTPGTDNGRGSAPTSGADSRQDDRTTSGGRKALLSLGGRRPRSGHAGGVPIPHQALCVAGATSVLSLTVLQGG